MLKLSINNIIGSCIHHLDWICVDEYDYHDSLQAHLIEA